MHTVTTLAIFSNNLTVLPPQPSQLKNLEELNIGDNIARIENIPVTIRRLSIYANPLDYAANGSTISLHNPFKRMTRLGGIRFIHSMSVKHFFDFGRYPTL